MLADLALGGALRQEVGRTRPLPTLSLTLDLAAPHDANAAATSAVVHEVAVGADGVGTAAGCFRGHGAVIGHCTATFAVPARGSQGELPWDDPSGSATHSQPSLLEWGDLGPDDQSLVRSVIAALDVEPSCGDTFLEEAMTSGPEGRALVPSAVMTNRAGAVQGGVLFAAAAHYGVPRGENAAPALISGSMRFLTGTSMGAPVVVESLTEHTTRRSVFTRVRLRQGQEVRAVGGFVHRR